MGKRLPDTVLLLWFFACAIPCQAQESVKLRASVVAKTFGFGPVWVASKQGFFNQQKLDVEVLLIRGSDVSTQALAAGSLQISGASSDAPIAAFDRGLDMVIIGGIINGLSQSLMGGKNYKSYEDLRGATLGANSLTAGTAFALRRVLKAKGLEYPRDYKLINVGGTPQALAALASGQIAAAPLSLPVNFVAEEKGFNTIGRFIDVIPYYQLSVYSVMRPWAEKNREVVVRFMKSIASAARWIFANRDAAVELLAKEMGLKREYARKGWEFYTEKGLWSPVGDVTLDGLGIVAQIYAEQNRIKGPPPNPAKYVDQSYLHAALRELDGR
ncbi:MAG TPA: ABC transporter substrate-binding protein [Terriglobales bacterium]|jgi:ABC-type nitrate/sulfonate/bicarbonate transport system substrate-binding protein|nr:ABC transporter substrate-binding protein [Terriglobales bacterium]